jgi:23S rRNA G2069 N7-methylase RlmK/C1962 C5-methylase RlmI
VSDLGALAEMLANRVRKNGRHLAKWARRDGVTCYRIYDRDIPEIPVTVDTYDGALVVNDYRAADRGGGDAWLDAMAGAARDATGASELFVKQRERLVGRRDGHQYERIDAQSSRAAKRPRKEGERKYNGRRRVVREGGHAFGVNLSDYLDTGLFLDHRITRARVAAEPGKTMLNLFAYTGAFSVYAAAAGMATTSVDLSNTYLEWARDNFALNQLSGDFVRADVRELLADARARGARWDVIVVDAPTFSNSKRMDYTWDVQRDHGALLADVLAVSSGVVWFATNRRRFKLEFDAPDVAIEDMTRATIPPDFRDAKVHHAFRISRR